MTRPEIADIGTALRIYYRCPEIGNEQINDLFGRKLADSTLAKLKNAVRKEMSKRGVITWVRHRVNTKIAYEVWGIDIEDLEKRRNKLMKLGMIGISESGAAIK